MWVHHLSWLHEKTSDFNLQVHQNWLSPPTKLTLMDPFHRGLTQSNSDAGRTPHYTQDSSTCHLLSVPHQKRTSIYIRSSCMERSFSTAFSAKWGSPSLLFHRTLSPKDTLQVQSYTLEKQRQTQTQLQVHSYAREHQPRHLQHKSYTLSHTQVQSSFQSPSCEAAEQQQESKFIIIKMAPTKSEAQSPEKQDQEEEKPEISTSVEAQPKVEEPEVEPESASTQVQPQPQELSNMGQESPKNKRKVSVHIFLTDTWKVWHNLCAWVAYACFNTDHGV